MATQPIRRKPQSGINYSIRELVERRDIEGAFMALLNKESYGRAGSIYTRDGVVYSHNEPIAHLAFNRRIKLNNRANQIHVRGIRNLARSHEWIIDENWTKGAYHG